MKRIIYLQFFLLVFILNDTKATIRYVDSSAIGANNGSNWTNAYTELSQAIHISNAATTVDTILVAQGTYYPTGNQAGTNRDSTLLIKRGGIKIYGGYPSGGGVRNTTSYPTILSGDIGASGNTGDNSKHVMVIAGIPSTADSIVIDGMKITSGNANTTYGKNYNGTTVSSNYGGGICIFACDIGQKLRLSNLRIVNCKAGIGAGMYVDGSAPLINYCQFIGNVATSSTGALHMNIPLGAYVTNSTFKNNSGTGVGAVQVFANVSNPNSIATFNTCHFSENSSNYGGAIFIINSTLNLNNSNVINNQATTFPGLVTGGGSNVNIKNCTIADNTTSGTSESVYIFQSTGTIHNTVIFNNTTGLGTSGSTVTTSHCLIQGQSSTANGNIDATCLGDIFVDTKNNNYRILPTSPTINAGDNSLFNTATISNFDVYGNNRILNTTIDIGAEEFICPTTVPNVLHVDSATTIAGDGSSWASPLRTLKSALDIAGACGSVDSILIAKGTYYPTGNPTSCDRSTSFLIGKNMVICGGYNATTGIRDLGANNTILSGNINNAGSANDNSYHVMVIASPNSTPGSIDSTTVIDGVIIQDAYADNPGGKTINGHGILQNEGGGIYVKQASPIFRNCIYSANYASNFGAGVYIADKTPSFINCVFHNNTTSGVFGTLGAGAFLIAAGANTSFTNCSFAGNYSSDGSAVHAYGGGTSYRVKNCIMWNYASGTPTSSLGWNNGAPQPTEVYHSILQGVGISAITSANGNSLTNPNYINAANGKGADGKWYTSDDGLQLGSGSPTPPIEGGNNSYVSAIHNDITGSYRILGCIVDMGAYENLKPFTIYVDSANGNDGNTGITWAQSFKTLSKALDYARTCLGVHAINVAKGTYYPTGNQTGTNRDSTFLITRGLKIFGGYPIGGGSRNIATNPTILSGDIGTINSNTDNSYHVMVVAGLASIADSVLIDGFTVTKGNANGTGTKLLNGKSINRFNGGGTVIQENDNIIKLVNNNIDNNGANAVGPLHGGGGLYSYYSSTIVSNCIFSNNIGYIGAGMLDVFSASIINNCKYVGNTASFDGGGLFENNSNSTINNCVFSGNKVTGTSYGGGGLYISTNTISTLKNCTFSGNIVNTGFAGVDLGTSGAILNMSNSIVYGNSSGIDNVDGTTIITYSLVQGLTGIANGNVNGNTDPLFVNPITTASTPTIAGDYSLQPCSPVINIGRNDSIPTGITTDVIGATRIFNTTVDMGAYEYQNTNNFIVGNVVYVDSANGSDANTGTSWTSAFKTLSNAFVLSQDTIGCYTNVDSILVAKGTYYPTGAQSGVNRDSTFLIKRGGLKIYGGYDATTGFRDLTINTTTLSGNINNVNDSADNSYHVVLIPNIPASADSIVVDGFTIEHGNAYGDGNPTVNGAPIHNGHGGGVFIEWCGLGGKLTLRNNVLRNNTAKRYAGALFVNGSAPLIADCNFTNNYAHGVNNTGGGAMATEGGGNATVYNSIFSNNNTAQHGGGVYNNGSLSVFTDCIFSGNTAINGGGMYSQSSTPTITSCDFLLNRTNNNGSGGGVYNNNSPAAINNCTFSGNTAANGGAIDCYGSNNVTIVNSIFINNSTNSNGVNTSGGIDNHHNSTMSLRNSSFYGNSSTAPNSGGGINNNNSGTATISNCIFWGNTGVLNDGVLNTVNGSSIVTYSDVEGNSVHPGVGNINYDPLFVNAANGNLRLQPCSPAINVGRNDSIPTFITSDLDGSQRIYIAGGIVDMGAYEYQFIPSGNNKYDTITQTVCQGDSILFNNQWVNFTGWYTDTLQTTTGCDSFVTLRLKVSPIPFPTNNIADQTICLGSTTSPIIFTSNQMYDTVCAVINENASTTLTAPTGVTFSEVLFASYGNAVGNTSTCSFTKGSCDASTTQSIIEDITLGNNSTNVSALNSIFGEPCYGITKTLSVSLTYGVNPDSVVYSWVNNNPAIGLAANGVGDIPSFTPVNIGTAPDTAIITVTANYKNCSSTPVSFMIIANPAIQETDTVTVCASQIPYTWNGKTNAQNGDTVICKTVGNCDSIATLALFVNPTINTTDVITICQNQVPYTWNGKINAQNGDTVMRKNVANCDSIITLNLTINPYNTATRVINICQGQTYTFNGVIYTNNVSNVKDTFMTVGGCDSIVTLNLTVDPYLTGNDVQTICQGQSYTFNGVVYFTSNTTATDTVQTVAGCDSIVTLNLVVTPSITNTINPTICQGQTYTFNSIVYTTSVSNVKDTFMAVGGCDSIVTMNLTVTPNITNTINPSVCQGQIYTFNSIIYTTSVSNVKDTFMAVGGCDSIVTMNLTVTPGITNTINPAICQGQSYTFNSIVYTTSVSNVKDTFMAAGGCDSIVTMNLTVTPNVTNTINSTICQGQSYTFNSIIYTTSVSNVKDTFAAVGGCDSVVTMNLTVNPYLTGTDVQTICQGQSYIFNGVVYTTSNSTATDTVQTSAGCDSIVTLNLVVTPGITNTINPSICQGQSYTFNSIIYTTSVSNVKDTFAAVGGCDSVVTMNLTVNPYLTGTDMQTICQGQTYSFNGVVYAIDNTTAKDTLQTNGGCDSIVTLNLTVNPYSTGTRIISICQGQSYTFNGITYTASNNAAKDTTISAAGCDSIITLNLTVNPYNTATRVVTICQGQSYTFNGISYNTNNSTAKDTVSGPACDTAVTLNLTVSPYLLGTRTISICQGQSYAFNGITYTSSNNTAKDTITSFVGCDSIITLNLVVNPYLTGTDVQTICQGQAYVFNGIAYTISNNTATDTLQTTAGCDSIVTLNLTVTPAITNTINPTICQGQTYTFNGVVYMSSVSNVKDTFMAVGGCDSVVTLNLTVSPYLTGTRIISICQGQSYTFNGIAYTSSNNTAKDTITSFVGCDSIITLNLIVNPYLTGTDVQTICQGQTYMFNGINYNTNNNTAKDTVSSQNGCDSIITLNLTVNPYNIATRVISICQGQSYAFNGINYNTNNNTAKDTVSGSLCDTIVTLNLIVNPYLTGTNVQTICQGQSFVFNGITYSTNNYTATDTVKNTSGCDSIIALNLTVTPYNTTTRLVTICQGQSYTFNGIIYTTSNTTAKDTVSGPLCDTVVTLNLTVNPYLTGTDVQTICQGQSYFFNGITYTSNNNTATDTLQTSGGCDSIVTLNLTVSPYLTGIQTAFICDGQSYFFNGINYSASNNSAKDTLQTSGGCDSIITLNLTTLPAAQPVTIDTGNCGFVNFEGITYQTSTVLQDTIISSLACDSLYRTINISVYPNTPDFVTLDTFSCKPVLWSGELYERDTTIEEMLYSVHGCDSLYRSIHISIDNFEIELNGDKPQPYKGEMVYFTTTSNHTSYDVYRWTPTSLFFTQDLKHVYAKFYDNALVTVYAASRRGCEDTASFQIDVQDIDHTVSIPTGFTPNADGRNDIFRPLPASKGGYTIKYFRIYNRWGMEVYHSMAARQNEGWDGTFKGAPQPGGVYNYLLMVEFDDGEKREMKGDVTLVR